MVILWLENKDDDDDDDDDDDGDDDGDDDDDDDDDDADADAADDDDDDDDDGDGDVGDDGDDDSEVWSEKPINMIMFMKYNQHNLIFQQKTATTIYTTPCHWHAQRLPLNPLANLVCCFSEGIWIIFHQPERHKKPVKIPMKMPGSMANINQTPRVWFSSSMVAPHFKTKHVVSERALICSGQINMWKIETWGHEYTTNPASNQANSSKPHSKKWWVWNISYILR